MEAHTTHVLGYRSIGGDLVGRLRIEGHLFLIDLNTQDIDARPDGNDQHVVTSWKALVSTNSISKVRCDRFLNFI